MHVVLEVRSTRLLVRAVDQDTATLAFLKPMLGVGSGEYAKELVKSEYDALPSSMGCTLMYWQSMLNESGYTKKLIRRLKKIF